MQGKKKANRIFYLSIPPSIFTDVAAAASDAASSPTGWNRVIVEKPFGRDLESYQVQQLSGLLDVKSCCHACTFNMPSTGRDSPAYELHA